MEQSVASEGVKATIAARHNPLAEFLAGLHETEADFLIGTVCRPPLAVLLDYLGDVLTFEGDGQLAEPDDYTPLAQRLADAYRESLKRSEARFTGGETGDPADDPIPSARLVARYLDDHPDGWLRFCTPLAMALWAQVANYNAAVAQRRAAARLEGERHCAEDATLRAEIAILREKVAGLMALSEVEYPAEPPRRGGLVERIFPRRPTRRL